MINFLILIPKSFLIILKANYYRFFNKPIAPRALTYIVTKQCNCKCFFCEIYRESSSEEELTYKDIKRTFQDRILQDMDLIRFTGGEPILKNDLREIIKTIYDNTKIKIFHLATNGSLTEEILYFIKDVTNYGINVHLQLSLDAVGKLHDEIRGFPGLFNRVYKTMEGLKKLQERRRFFVGINQTIFHQNINQIDEVNKLADYFGFSHNIAFANIFHESREITTDTSKYPTPFKLLTQFSRDELINLYRKVEDINLCNKSIRLNRNYFGSYLRSLSEFYLHEGGKNRILFNKDIPKPKCMALFTHFRLLPNGDITPCHLKSKRIIGNIKYRSFSEIWFSKEASAERKEVKSCKGCWIECEIVPSIFYSGDIIKWFLKNRFNRLLRKK